MLKRVNKSNIKEKKVAFCSPITGEMILSDGTALKFKIVRKIGKTPLNVFLDACTDDRLFLVCKLTDTNRDYFNVDGWLSDGIFKKRSFTFTKDKRSIEIRGMSESFFPTCINVKDAYEAYQQLNNMCKDNEKINMPLLTSPSYTGMVMLEKTLPYKLALQSLKKEYETIVRENTTQPRKELLALPEIDTINNFYYLDGRWMYAACLDYEFPIGEPIYDTNSYYQMYIPGWYRVIATVPNGWNHIGLIPVKRDDKWVWPTISNEKITTWIAEPELRLAVDKGWNVKVIERLLFPKDRPFRNWKKLLVDMRNEAYALENPIIRKHVSDGCRELMLSGIGRLYTSEWNREKKLSIQEYQEQYEELSAYSRLNAVRVKDTMIFPIKDKLGDKEDKYYHPYLPAYVWSYCRRLLSIEMLKYPREQILGCNLDAIYLHSEIPNVIDIGRIGEFRLKGKILGSIKNPKTMDELTELKRQSELNIK